MALSPYKTWIAGEILTAADLNASFTQITSNGISLISPLTASFDLDGQSLILDSAAVTTLNSTAGTAALLTPGVKTGAPGATGSIIATEAQTFTDSDTAGSGTAALYTGVSIGRPTLAATNASVTTTDAATLYIPNAPAAGTNETLTNAWALLVAAGAVKFAGGTTLGATLDVTGTANFSAAVNTAQSSNIASATTIDLDAATGNIVDVTGTTAITTITLSQGRSRIVRFTGILTLTNGSSLLLPGAANITTAAGDYALFVGYGSGVVRCVLYTVLAKRLVLGASLTTTGAGAPTLAFSGTSRVYTFPDRAITVGAASGAIFNATVGDPSGTTDTGGVMMGLGSTFTITPLYNTRVHFAIQGTLSNNTVNDGAQVNLRYGTGTAPVNGAAAAGTSLGGNIGFQAFANNAFAPFYIAGIASGLTIGTAYWFDVLLAAVTAGAALISGNTGQAFEL